MNTVAVYLSSNFEKLVSYSRHLNEQRIKKGMKSKDHYFMTKGGKKKKVLVIRMDAKRRSLRRL